MISVGIDISKGKSTVCIRNQENQLREPFEILHTEDDLDALCTLLKDYCHTDKVRIVMEATGIYHLPVLMRLMEAGMFVCVINPLLMKKFAAQTIRRGKNDKRDAMKIADYGIEKWYSLVPFSPQQQLYEELRLLGRQYMHYVGIKIKCKQNLSCLLERTMPGIAGLIASTHTGLAGKDKLLDFVEEYWHYDNITAMQEEAFIDDYSRWAKAYGYRPSREKALQIYHAAHNSIATLPATHHSCHFLMQQTLHTLREIMQVTTDILRQMQQLATQLPEYNTVRSMDGVGDVLALRLIAEIGDIRRFHSAGSLIAYAGIDSPDFQSGIFQATQRRISKRGSPLLRKTGYEIMQSLKRIQCVQSPVYQYIVKKETEGKHKKAAKIAGLNKFLRIYYARVSACYTKTIQQDMTL